MSEIRELRLNEKSTLICGLAEERTKAYSKAIELRDKSEEIENRGQSGYGALDEEAEKYEVLADETDCLIELICEGRLVIKERENEGA